MYAPSAPPYAPPSAPSQEPPRDPALARLDKLRELCRRHEIKDEFAAKLRQLESFDIVLLVDDSGSMSTGTDAILPGTGSGLSGSSSSGNGARGAFSIHPTRWNEAEAFCRVAVDIAACLDADGVDVRFLNRHGFSGVTKAEQVHAAFVPPPSGFTPLTAAVQSIIREKAAVIAEKKLLLIILTDGEPTDTAGKVDIEEFTRTLHGRPANVYVTIMACTDDSSSVEYLNKLDHIEPHLDVVDDFASERREVQLAHPGMHFTFGDWVTKGLLGSVDQSMDKLDEIPPIPMRMPTQGQIPGPAEIHGRMPAPGDDGCGCIVA